jgi:hypothetical protein
MYGLKSSKKYPKGVYNMAPEWVYEDGSTCLKFNGKGNYVQFPVEVLPRLSGFTISFDIKPLSSKEQILLRCANKKRLSSLSLKLKDSMLVATYRHIAKKYINPWWVKEKDIISKLKVKPNQWAHIKIVYNQKEFVFSVNKKESQPIPCAGPGYHIGFLSFGGAGDDWFCGYLKSLSIHHAVE